MRRRLRLQLLMVIRTLHFPKPRYHLAIRTAENYIAELIDLSCISMNSFIDIVSPGTKAEFSLRLERGTADPKRVRKIKTINAVLFDKRRNKNIKCIVHTPRGSFIRTDFGKRTSFGKIVQDDPDSLFFFRRWFLIFALFNSLTRLHAMLMRAGTNVFLLTGRSGSGKTTLANLLAEQCGCSILTRDVCYLINAGNSVSAYDSAFLSGNKGTFLPPPSTILFLKKDLRLKSRITPLPRKESFKQLCFLSEFPSLESPLQKKRRMDTLFKLAKQSAACQIVSGNDLKTDPAAVQRIYDRIIRNKKPA